MNNEKKSYPLCWPDGWPRTNPAARQNSRFQSRGYGHSMESAANLLQAELDRLGAVDAILSTNIKLRLDGVPYSNASQPTDTGAAVFFKLKGKPVALACDRWRRVECNAWAIAKHIEALRGQERWGVGNLSQAFRGYLAIPERASGESPWEVLGVTINASEEQVTDAFRKLAKTAHPDAGGSIEAFDRIRQAHDLIMQQVRTP